MHCADVISFLYLQFVSKLVGISVDDGMLTLVHRVRTIILWALPFVCVLLNMVFALVFVLNVC